MTEMTSNYSPSSSSDASRNVRESIDNPDKILVPVLAIHASRDLIGATIGNHGDSERYASACTMATVALAIACHAAGAVDGR